jgi:hypothetical protein
MLRTHRKIVAAVLLAAGIAGVGVTAGARLPAADEQEKKAREELQAAEALLQAAEAQVKLARAKYERAKNAQVAQKEAALRQRLQSVEWTVEEIRAAGAGAFTLRLSHFQRLFLTALPVARDARVSIDNVPGKLADLKVGMRLDLRLAADDLVVTKIDAFTPEELHDYRVKEVDAAKQTLSVSRAGKEFVTGLFVGDAGIFLEGEESDLTKVKPGMQVSLSFVVTGGQLSLRKIQARK